MRIGASILALAATALLLAAAVPSQAQALPYREVTAPEGRSKGTVLLVHGGGWYGGERFRVVDLRPTARRLARWGWEVWNVDYRSGRRSVRDVVAWHDRLARRTGRPICIMGESAGAQLVLVVALRRSVDCVIAEGTPTVLGALPEPGLTWARRAFGDDLWRFSPLRFATRVGEPLLMGHARADRHVPVRQARRLKRRRAGTRLSVLASGGAPFVHERVRRADLRDYRERQRHLLARASLCYRSLAACSRCSSRPK